MTAVNPAASDVTLTVSRRQVSPNVTLGNPSSPPSVSDAACIGCGRALPRGCAAEVNALVLAVQTLVGEGGPDSPHCPCGSGR